MKYDYFAFLKEEKFDEKTYNNLKNNDNLYFIHAKRDKLFGNKVKDSNSWYFRNKKEYSLSEDFISKSDVVKESFLKTFCFGLTLTSPFFTASENKFYSIDNPIAKERVTGSPLLKGSSLKGALRQTAVDIIESELLEKNYGDKLNSYTNDTDEEIEQIETNNNDRFFFKRRDRLVRLFGNERDIRWFTFKTLLATGGIRDASKIKEVLDKISFAFESYLRKSNITDKDGNSKGRLIFEDLHFKKVTLDVITPLDRKKRTPVHGPIYYEVVPKGEVAIGKIIWFPFDLIARGEFEGVEDEWREDKKIIKDAFERLSKKGIGAKTKDGWGRFNREGM